MEGMVDEYVTHSFGLPRFVIFNSPLYLFLPNRASDLGMSTISG
jgi:hypothetical protein